MIQIMLATLREILQEILLSPKDDDPRSVIILDPTISHDPKRLQLPRRLQEHRMASSFRLLLPSEQEEGQEKQGEGKRSSWTNEKTRR